MWCFDDEGNDKIDFREFLLLVQNYERPLSEEQEIREMFNAIDTDHNGFIDVDELKSTFSNLGVPLTNADIRDMLKEANVHGTRIFYEGIGTCQFCLYFVVTPVFYSGVGLVMHLAREIMLWQLPQVSPGILLIVKQTWNYIISI